MAYLYLIPFTDGLMKFGISESASTRISTHKKQYPVKDSGIVVYQSTTKRVALVERLIKTEVKFKSTHHDGKDGYTEICDISYFKACKRLASVLGKPVKHINVRNYGIAFVKPECEQDIRDNIADLKCVKRIRDGKLFMFNPNLNEECMPYFQYVQNGKLVGLTSFTDVQDVIIMSFSDGFVL